MDTGAHMKNAFDMLGSVKTKSKLQYSDRGVKKVRNTEEEDAHGAVIEWAKLQPFNRRKVFDYLIHHPAEGQRGFKAQATAKKLGLKRGVLDLQLMVPIGSVPGLWIEMKAKDGRWSKEQEEFRMIAEGMGYVVYEARSAEQCIAIIKQWLSNFEAHRKSE